MWIVRKELLDPSQQQPCFFFSWNYSYLSFRGRLFSNHSPFLLLYCFLKRLRLTDEDFGSYRDSYSTFYAVSYLLCRRSSRKWAGCWRWLLVGPSGSGWRLQPGVLWLRAPEPEGSRKWCGFCWEGAGWWGSSHIPKPSATTKEQTASPTVVWSCPSRRSTAWRKHSFTSGSLRYRWNTF